MANKVSLKKPPSAEMCPPGYHVVQGFERTCHSGTKTWVDAHIRKNRGKIKPGLLKENLHFLFWNNGKKYPSLAAIEGYDNHEYDSLIQFWLDYWKIQGVKFPDDLDPLMVKALIAVESGFDPNAKSKESTATGLMQVTNQSLRVLGGFPNKAKWIEARDHLIHVSKEEKLDPVVSVALGTRLLGHKYSKIPKGREKNAITTIEGYHSFDSKGKAYAKKVIDFYNKSRVSK